MTRGDETIPTRLLRSLRSLAMTLLVIPLLTDALPGQDAIKGGLKRFYFGACGNIGGSLKIGETARAGFYINADDHRADIC